MSYIQVEERSLTLCPMCFSAQYCICSHTGDNVSFKFGGGKDIIVHFFLSFVVCVYFNLKKKKKKLCCEFLKYSQVHELFVI